MDDVSDANNIKSKMKDKDETEELDSEESCGSEDDDETIARIQRAHFAQAAAMTRRRRPPPKPRRMSQKRKLEAVKSFHDFTKKLKQDTGIKIRSLPDRDMLGYNVFDSSESTSETESDGLSEEEFEVNPQAVQELNEENQSYIDPETGDIIEHKVVQAPEALPLPINPEVSKSPTTEEAGEVPKTLTISDIINEGGLDLSKNEEIGLEKTAEELLDLKQDDVSQDYDITEKLQEMGEISVKSVKSEEATDQPDETEEKKSETEEEKKAANNSILNVRRNIREVMDEKQLDASTLAAQRQESERLARVQEQQRIIREVQRQIALNRQNKIHQKTISLLQGGTSILKKGAAGQKLNLPNTVLVKLPSGETKKTTMKQGVMEVTKISKPGPSVGQKIIKQEKKEVVEIVDSSSGEESSSSSSDSDDCIMLSDSELPPSPEAEDDPGNSGLHVNDTYNIPDEQGRVQINVGHPENEEDIFLAPQIARVIKPHQIGGVRFLFDNIIESTERFSTSTGFGCILAHSMGLGKTLQIVSFTDIFLRHTKSKTVLCIMPINTLQNWVAEFNMWLPTEVSLSPLSLQGEVRPRNFSIYVLNDSHKTLQMRAKVVKDWTTTGGVLMIGYELYRLLSMKKDKKPRKKRKDAKAEEKDEKEKKIDINEDTQGSESTNVSKVSDCAKMDDLEKTDEVKDEANKKADEPIDEDKKLLDEMYEALVKPGPDLVICDEGHRIKNSHSNISYALKQMRTKRRVVLTGYPLQNNLLEYWCMVDFVRPNYLGSKTEFCNMFERPIQNGQCIDSTPQDIRLMRYRAHVLHSLLVGFVQRRSHAVLQSTLPQKAEYVLLVRMTPLQRKLYDQFMNEVVRTTTVPNPLKAFAICCKIWNHPDVLYNFLKKRSEVNALIEEDLDLEEIGGVTKAGGRATRSKAPPKRTAKPRGSSKKPAATIPPNVNTNAIQKPNALEPNNPNYGNPPYNQYGPNNQYRPDQSYPPQSTYPNQPGYYPPNQGYNQNYGNNYYQQPPYNYPNQYPPNQTPDQNQGYNQNYWNNGNYYGNPGYYNNQPYPNNQPNQDYRNAPHNAPTNYNNQQPQYPYNSSTTSSDPPYQTSGTPYQNTQDPYANQQRPPYQNNPQQPYPNPQQYPPYPNQPQGYTHQPYSNQYPNDYNQYNPQYDPRGSNYSNYQNNQTPQGMTQNNQLPGTPQTLNIPNPTNQPVPSRQINNLDPTYPQTDSKDNINTPPDPYRSNYPTFTNNMENQVPSQNMPLKNLNNQPGPSTSIITPKPIPSYTQNDIKPEETNTQRPVPYRSNYPNYPHMDSQNPSQNIPLTNHPGANLPINAPKPIPSYPQNEIKTEEPNTQSNPYRSNYQNFPHMESNLPTQNIPLNNHSHSMNTPKPVVPNYPTNDLKTEEPNIQTPDPFRSNYPTYPNNMENHQSPPNIPANNPGPSHAINTTNANNSQNEIKTEESNQYGASNYNYNQQNDPHYSATFNQFSAHLETKTPIGSTGSPLSAWPLTEALKMDSDKPIIEKDEVKSEVKSESDSEVKIEDLDTKKIILNDKDIKKDSMEVVKTESDLSKGIKSDLKKSEPKEKSDESGSEDEGKRNKKDKKKSKKNDSKRASKAKSKGKNKKDQKSSKDGSDSDAESEKEEKPNREEELAMVKKAEEVTYDWATELLKDYIPGIIENSAKMELFFLILNESILLGDRILLFSQSLFTLNLIEDFLERNYIPGTNVLWERNTSYYRLDGSTHALEREKLINEFNANPNIYLFLVSTRAGSLGINLVGANRVIVFDASWNPCHDTQAVCRVYRYGQKKPCFVYRFVMDWCLEKKIYDRQINKQGMADRVVDECNPDAVLSMKEITNLCFDNDEKENEAKDLSEHKDKYIDVVMQKIIGEYGKLLSKEPFQHESLLVDRKEKKLSSAEKRLAQRGYELEKKAALAPKPTPLYRTVRAPDGSLVQRPVASVRPMQHAARWIPADVWRRQGMTAQEMTLPLDVVIPTNSAERTNIVLKAGQRVMVLKSPKGIYMQLESGKIIAIKTSFKGLPQKGDGKDIHIGKKVINRGAPAIPGSLKNNSAITITSKSGPRPILSRVGNRQVLMGPNKNVRSMLAGQAIRRPLPDPKAILAMRARNAAQNKIRPTFPGSLSITKVPKRPNLPNDLNIPKISPGDTHVLDSDEEDEVNDSTEPETTNTNEDSSYSESKPAEKSNPAEKTNPVVDPPSENSSSLTESKQKSSTEESKQKSPPVESTQKSPPIQSQENPSTEEPTQKPTTAEPKQIQPTVESKETLSIVEPKQTPQTVEPNPTTQIVEPKQIPPITESKNVTLTTDETLPSESVLDDRIVQEEKKLPNTQLNILNFEANPPISEVKPDQTDKSSKISLLKNYRHQRPTTRPSIESSLSQLERTAIALNTEGMPDFRRNLDDITQSYSPSTEERPTSKSRKKKSPTKIEPMEVANSEKPGMSHSVSNLLGNSLSPKSRLGNEIGQNLVPVAPLNSSPNMPQARYYGQNSLLAPNLGPGLPPKGFNNTGGVMIDNSKTSPSLPVPVGSPETPPVYPNPADPYRQYPGYSAAYPPATYPAPPYYGYAGYYPPYPAPPPHTHYPPAPAPVPAHTPNPSPAPAPAPTEHYAPNRQW